MRLREIIDGVQIEEVRGDLDPEITGLTSNSKDVKAGYLFICLKGQRFDGHDFLHEAIDNGARAVVVERDVGNVEGATSLRVGSTRRVQGLLASRFYSYPSKRLRLIGVTGTNGKTTVTYLVEAILKRGGCGVGRISTTTYSIDGEEKEATLTTPDALELQSILARMESRGVRYVVMEVSSHALSMERVGGCEFNEAIFTNLTQDHLDFHHTMEEYFEAKMRLFDYLKSPDGVAIINLDDPRGKEILSRIKERRIITYGLREGAQLLAKDVRIGREGTSFLLNGELIKLRLIGRHNLSNALAAIGVGLAEGFDLSTIKEGLMDVRSIPGRLEFLDCGQGFLVFVDYAHTPGALEAVLATIRELRPKRIITVFGCGGERDREKRPIMGEVASRLSDLAIITNDNPRGEDPISIIKDIERGIKSRNYKVIEDRREAIRYAINEAKEGDAVLIAGKGHEGYQIIGGLRIPFDDRAVAHSILKGRE